jgi:hypothetical protein
MAEMQSRTIPTFEIDARHEDLLTIEGELSPARILVQALRDNPDLAKVLAAGCHIESHMAKNEDGSYTVTIRTKNKVKIEGNTVYELEDHAQT